MIPGTYPLVVPGYLVHCQEDNFQYTYLLHKVPVPGTRVLSAAGLEVSNMIPGTITTQMYQWYIGLP